MTIKKKDLIRFVSHETGYSFNKVKEFTHYLISSLEEAFVFDESVKIASFGVFKKKKKRIVFQVTSSFHKEMRKK